MREEVGSQRLDQLYGWSTCGCRECHPSPAISTLTPGLKGGEHRAITFTFLYWAFYRVLQLIQLIGGSDTDLAIEVIMLRHEVAVRRRQVHQPMLESVDRAVLAGLAEYSRADNSGASFSDRKPPSLAPGSRRWALDLPCVPRMHPANVS